MNKVVIEMYYAKQYLIEVFDTLSDYTLKQINGVIGIRIEVTDWTLKYKLSQNRDDKDYARIIEELYKTDNLMDTMLADEMRKLRGV